MVIDGLDHAQVIRGRFTKSQVIKLVADEISRQSDVVRESKSNDSKSNGWCMLAVVPVDESESENHSIPRTNSLAPIA